jgi:hypothetical protein
MEKNTKYYKVAKKDLDKKEAPQNKSKPSVLEDARLTNQDIYILYIDFNP